MELKGIEAHDEGTSLCKQVFREREEERNIKSKRRDIDEERCGR